MNDVANGPCRRPDRDPADATHGHVTRTDATRLGVLERRLRGAGGVITNPGSVYVCGTSRPMQRGAQLVVRTAAAVVASCQEGPEARDLGAHGSVGDGLIRCG